MAMAQTLLFASRRLLSVSPAHDAADTKRRRYCGTLFIVSYRILAGYQHFICYQQIEPGLSAAAVVYRNKLNPPKENGGPTKCYMCPPGSTRFDRWSLLVVRTEFGGKNLVAGTIFTTTFKERFRFLYRSGGGTDYRAQTVCYKNRFGGNFRQ